METTEVTMADSVTGRQKQNNNLARLMLQGRRLPFHEKINFFREQVGELSNMQEHLYFRTILSKPDREVSVQEHDGQVKKMLMFGSNNYLGLANHPYVKEKVKKYIDEYGVGVGGPPLLNGYTKPMRELEERLTALKGTEDTMIYTSGYNANLGMITGLCTPDDILIADEYSHASFFDGVRMMNGKCFTFHHNQVDDLEKQLVKHCGNINGNIFVAAEGVYSMDGDIAPLDKIIPLCKKYNATFLLDDAHATGVLGKNGGGSHEFFNIVPDEDIILGTFSKAFAVNGGFISASKPIISYLRLLSRSYMFSAALPPITIASVLAGLDVIENEPQLITQLYENVKYLTDKLNRFGLSAKPMAGIIALSVPSHVDIKKLSHQYHDAGIFLNAIEYPAVPISKQRFRISCMATHTKDDLDKLVSVTEEIWFKNEC